MYDAANPANAPSPQNAVARRGTRKNIVVRTSSRLTIAEATAA
ncbi:MAG TPA: hypothetical protein VD971_11245 [Phycisphaerales bacterium]|nr:hypothetical protein [Phycisphaerales bacterium]